VWVLRPALCGNSALAEILLGEMPLARVASRPPAHRRPGGATMTLLALPRQPRHLTRYPWQAMIFVGDAFEVSGVTKKNLQLAIRKYSRRTGKRFKLTGTIAVWRVERIG
jgi:hypothetical protein